MKTTLCSFCLKSGILCPRCQERFESGEVDEVDIRVGRLLLELEEGYPSLQRISFHKAYEVDGILALVVGRGDLPHLLGYGGKIVRELFDKTGKRVRIIEEGGETRKFLEDLFAPVKLVTINRIWLPDGSTETRVILSGHRRRLPANVRTLKELAKSIRGMTLRVEFERPRRR
ncbi:MAG: hypothetical protein ACE5Z5_14220 [Candidatus Bathyarchaeia archaeon]